MDHPWEPEIEFCPGCGEALSAHTPADNAYECRHCGGRFVIEVADGNS